MINCEKCNKKIEKGYVETIETTNLIFYLCMDCMLKLEDKIEEWMK